MVMGQKSDTISVLEFPLLQFVTRDARIALVPCGHHYTSASVSRAPMWNVRVVVVPSVAQTFR